VPILDASSAASGDGVLRVADDIPFVCGLSAFARMTCLTDCLSDLFGSVFLADDTHALATSMVHGAEIKRTVPELVTNPLVAESFERVLDVPEVTRLHPRKVDEVVAA